MGGMGSGPRRPGGRKLTVESRPRLTISALRHAGGLVDGAAGTLECRPLARPLARTESPSAVVVKYAVSLGQDTGTLRVAHACATTGVQREYALPLLTTPCRFGGIRWWLGCPLGGGTCESRVAAMYLGGPYFGCRHCLGLTYASTQQSDRRVRAFVRNGISEAAFAALPAGSVAEMGFKLKVFDYQVRSLDRALRR